jgi:hypothetical protein
MQATIIEGAWAEADPLANGFFASESGSVRASGFGISIRSSLATCNGIYPNAPATGQDQRTLRSLLVSCAIQDLQSANLAKDGIVLTVRRVVLSCV